jgi:uncharacterized membrane-anchored protein YitT (DUF2179 family)
LKKEMSETNSIGNNSIPSSEDFVSVTMQRGLERIIVSTFAGVIAGGFAGIVLFRGGSSGARKVLAGFGGGLGLGSSWTQVSIDLESVLQNKKN